MRKWMLLAILLALVLALAACGGDGDDDKDSDGGPPETENETVPVAPDTDATEEASSAAVLSVAYDPGPDMQTGLTLLTYSVYPGDETTHFFAEVRNDTGHALNRALAHLYALDQDGYPLGPLMDASSLLNDIPAGQAFYVASEFATPELFADVFFRVEYETGEPGPLRGFYGLPVTVEYQGPGETMPYVVRGSAENNTGQDLMLPVIDVALTGPDDELVGLSHGVVDTGTADGTWSAGQAAVFEAPFTFVAVEPDRVQEVKIAAAGYAPVE
ncbi:MAG: hypothetical protein JXJ20_02180 [Anaerolineae bacterium]|jgi:hypothetical protein|nr:hypothetical protein [Anaerolineae bacterium]